MATFDRVLVALDGDALDRAVGAWLADRAADWREGSGRGQAGAGGMRRRLRAIVVDGKALKGSKHLEQRHRHLLSAVDQDARVTLAQVEVERKTNETAGATNIAKTTRAIRDEPAWALSFLGINYNPHPSGT